MSVCVCVQRSVNDIFVGVLRLFALVCWFGCCLSAVVVIVLVFMIVFDSCVFLSLSFPRFFFFIKMYFTRCVSEIHHVFVCVCVYGFG